MARFSKIRNARVFAFPPPAVLELGRAGGFDFELQDRAGLGHEKLMAARNQLLGMAAQDPVLARVRPNGLEDVPEYRVDVDWEKAGALGVEGGNPDAAQDDHRDGKPVIGQQGAEGNAAARHPDACRDQPGLRKSIRVEPEEGLDDGGGDAQGGNETRGRCVAEMIFGYEKGQQGRHGPLVEVREQVTQRGQPDESVFHGSSRISRMP